MLRFLFDTDHLSLFQHGHPVLLARVASHGPDTVGICPVTVEEMFKGRLAALNRRVSGSLRIQLYARLVNTVQICSQFPVIAYDQNSENQLVQLQSLKLRIGAADRKIAAIALAHKLVLLTRNKRDFAKVSGLTIDDWSV